MRLRKNHLGTIGVCVGMLVSSKEYLRAQSSLPLSTNRLESLEKENQELKKRLDALEAVAQKEGLRPSGAKADPPVGALSQIQISGFVTASYFHDSNNP